MCISYKTKRTCPTAARCPAAAAWAAARRPGVAGGGGRPLRLRYEPLLPLLLRLHSHAAGPLLRCEAAGLLLSGCCSPPAPAVPAPPPRSPAAAWLLGWLGAATCGLRPGACRLQGRALRCMQG